MLRVLSVLHPCIRFHTVCSTDCNTACAVCFRFYGPKLRSRGRPDPPPLVSIDKTLELEGAAQTSYFPKQAALQGLKVAALVIYKM